MGTLQLDLGDPPGGVDELHRAHPDSGCVRGERSERQLTSRAAHGDEHELGRGSVEHEEPDPGDDESSVGRARRQRECSLVPTGGISLQGHGGAEGSTREARQPSLSLGCVARELDREAPEDRRGEERCRQQHATHLLQQDRELHHPPPSAAVLGGESETRPAEPGESLEEPRAGVAGVLHG
jgi:hypothetical protein